MNTTFEEYEEFYKFKCSCGWFGTEYECEIKHFGRYCGLNNDYDSWGWEEWDDFVCPECGKEIE